MKEVMTIMIEENVVVEVPLLLKVELDFFSLRFRIFYLLFLYSIISLFFLLLLLFFAQI